MPIPAYVMCSSSGAVDQRTNLVSLFNVVEAIDVYAAGTPEKDIKTQAGRGNSLFVMAVWLREDADLPSAKYDGEIAIILPTGEELVTVGARDFEFPQSDVFFRFQAPTVPLVGFPSLGICRVEAR